MQRFVTVLFALALLCGCAGQAQSGGTLELGFLDVGQGDSILITSPSGQNVLIDGGRKDDEVLDYLQAIGVKSIYMVIATHADADHIGGLEAVVRAYRPRFFIDNEIPSTTQTYEGLLQGVAEAGSQVAAPTARNVDLGGASLRIIPPPGVAAWGNNDNSVGVVVEYGAFRAALTGDAEDQEFGWWIENGLLEPVDVYKASHHGSANGDTQASVTAFVPESVVISVGFENSYGHPDDEALELYRGVGAEVYRTDESGTITVTASADGSYTVDTTPSTAGGGEAREPEAVPNAIPPPHDSSGEDRDCGDFSSQTEAQAFFEAAGAGDPHRLDSDGDGVVCESLP